MKDVTLFTDGSCLGNPGPGGWACILKYRDHERILQGGEARTTNNRMELLAALNGLQALIETCKVAVITDSLYLQQGMTTYVQRWRRRNWVNGRGEPIANRDLWERLMTQAGRHETVWLWVRGHGSDPDQDRCDALAQHCARSAASWRRTVEPVT